jgi:DNA polymerase III subunit epsilon
MIARLQRWLGLGREPLPRGERWVVLDTETSGLDPDRDRLIAIGGVALDRAGLLPGDSFEVVLQSDAGSSDANIMLHGIGRGAQAAGVPAAQALRAFRDWAADAPRVGFHADFDRVVLERAFARAGIDDEPRPWLDLAPLASALEPRARRYGAHSLDDWLAAFGIECTVRHNAAADAFATAELLLRLRSMAAKQGAHGFDALAKVARQNKWLGDAD